MWENNKQDEEVLVYYCIVDVFVEVGLFVLDLLELNDLGIFVLDGKGWIFGGLYGFSVWIVLGSLIMVQWIEFGDFIFDEV